MKLRRILALLLSFVLVMGAVPMAMAAGNDVTLEVVANKTNALIGDTVKFTYYLCGADETDGVKNFKIDVDLGSGLEYVSYSISTGASSIFAGLQFNEDNMRALCSGTIAEDPYKGSSIALLTITCEIVGETGVYATASVASFVDANYKRLNTEIINDEAVVSVHSHDDLWYDSDDTHHWLNCEVCGEVDKEEHTLELMMHVDPFYCVSDGYDLYYCPICYYQVQKNIVPKDPHTDDNHDGSCDLCGEPMETTHELTHVAATEPTCTEDGNTEYWYCAGCDKYYSDAEGENEIAEGSWVIEALGHNHVTVKGYDATCTTNGLTDGEYCDRCDKVFAEQRVIPAYGHDWEIKEESETEIIWECVHCGATMTEELDPNTTVEVRADGTVVITTLHEDGTKTVEVRKDGVTVVMLIDDKDNIIDMDVTVSGRAATEAEKTGKTIVLPMDVYKLQANGAVDVTFTVHTEGAVDVELAVANVTPGCVVVIVNEDGSETIVANTKMTENGLAFGCTDGVVVKVVNKAMSFADVKGTAWYGDAVAFVTARGIMNGMGNNSFGPTSTTTRAQVWAMLARLSGVDAYGAEWATIAREWAMANGITDGERADDSITRQELVTMLYRYTGSPAVTGDLSAYTDAASVSAWAKDAMTWAVSNGIVKGVTETTLVPGANATRAQVATIMQRYAGL